LIRLPIASVLHALVIRVLTFMVSPSDHARAAR
jgi:hypothetical protein